MTIKAFSILTFNLCCNAEFFYLTWTLFYYYSTDLLRWKRFLKEIFEGCLGFSWWQKLDQKISLKIATREQYTTVFDFKVDLRKVAEKFPLHSQAWDHFTIISTYRAADGLLNVARSCVTGTRKWIIYKKRFA